MILLDKIKNKRVVSADRLLLIIALYIVLLNSGALWGMMNKSMGGVYISQAVFLSSFLVLLIILLLLLLSASDFVGMVKSMAIFALILSAVIAYFIDNILVVLGDPAMWSTVKTDWGEAGKLIGFDLLWYLGVFGVFPSLLVAYAKLNTGSCR